MMYFVVLQAIYTAYTLMFSPLLTPSWKLALTYQLRMLDERSLDIISRFKSAVLTKVNANENTPTITSLNRGKKLLSNRSKGETLTSKIVEYNGSNRLVFTNDIIERSSYRNKRRWLDFYGSEVGNVSSDDAFSDSDHESGFSDVEENEGDDNPFKKLKLSEILAPLAHPSEVVTHPAVSKTYKLTCLPGIASDLIDLIELEQNTLNHFNKLLRVLNGEDWFFILEDSLGLPDYDHGLDEQAVRSTPDADGDFIEGDTTREPLDRQEEMVKQRMDKALKENGYKVEDPFFALPKSLARYEAHQRKLLEEAPFESSDKEEQIQQDLINYLQLSIQRQQEYIKNLTTIRNGIVKADRYRNDIHRWGKEMGERKN